MYSHLISVSIHTRINWGKRIAETMLQNVFSNEYHDLSIILS